MDATTAKLPLRNAIAKFHSTILLKISITRIHSTLFYFDHYYCDDYPSCYCCHYNIRKVLHFNDKDIVIYKRKICFTSFFQFFSLFSRPNTIVIEITFRKSLCTIECTIQYIMSVSVLTKRKFTGKFYFEPWIRIEWRRRPYSLFWARIDA